MKASLQVDGLRKTYPSPAEDLVVLDGLELQLSEGDSLAVTGPSGCGKSTLLHVLGTLDTPTEGRVAIGGEDPFHLSAARLAAFRNKNIGFVFQDHHLLPQCTALENVLTPCIVGGGVDSDAIDWARSLLERVGLESRMEHRPAHLSGGERQRVAIARALVRRPLLLLCDEPTGNLDAASAERVGSLFLELQSEMKSILVVVTHSLELASRFDRSVLLQSGQLEACGGNAEEGS